MRACARLQPSDTTSGYMCVDTSVHMYVDMSEHMHVHMCVDMCVDMGVQVQQACVSARVQKYATTCV